MTRYTQDDRGRLFRWDAGLHTWFRVVSHDDEYDEASRAVLAHGTGAGPAPQQVVAAPPRSGATPLRTGSVPVPTPATVFGHRMAAVTPRAPGRSRADGGGASIVRSIRTSHGPDRRTSAKR